MKKFLVALLAVCMSASLAACGENAYTGYASGDVTLGQYRGVEYTAVSTEVSAEEVEAKINAFLIENLMTVSDEEKIVAENGDIVNINYRGLIADQAFEGGTAENVEITLGSGRMIPGFEEGIVGMVKGEMKDIIVTFPDSYPQNTELEGVEARFAITLNDILRKEMPELTDEFVSEKTDSTTVEEYRQSVFNELKAEKEADAESQKKYEVMKSILASSKFNKNLAEQIVVSKQNLISQNNATYSQYYGVDIATFYNYVYGLTAEQFDEYMEAVAKINLQVSFVLSAVADAENITISEDELNFYATATAASYGLESVDILYAQLQAQYDAPGKTVLEEQLRLDRAASIIYDSAVAR